jgi:hypothetical protein
VAPRTDPDVRRYRIRLLLWVNDIGALPLGNKPWGVGVDGRVPLLAAPKNRPEVTDDVVHTIELRL